MADYNRTENQNHLKLGTLILIWKFIMKRRNPIITAILIIGFVVIAGMGFAKLGAQGSDVYPANNTRAQLERFVEVFNDITRFYVERPDKEKLITGAIKGMLSELDPHSVYIPKKSLKQITEQFEGHYEGIGIEFIVQNKILTVVSPIVGGPAEAVGLLPGDQIIKINGESAYGITESEVQKKLKGPKGTKVTVTIRRPGQGETFDVTITRDRIPIYSVTASFMLDDGKTGYIYLGRFARTTSEEMEKAMRDLEAKGMKRLILDLRLNSGGYLDQAVEVADKFIPGGYKIVYTRGRIRSSDQDYYSTTKATHPFFPLIVMIDRGSASASEIVAGAIQDLDRGLVVGETSFGKGLVQNQLLLRDGSALRITVARYYTPSGRLIQRPYDGSLMDYYTEAYDESRDEKVDSTKVFKTLAGRTVYGGGGIKPDTTLKSPRITRFTNRLIAKRLFFEFGSQYVSKHKKWPGNFDSFRENFRIDDAMLADFRSIIKKHDVEFSQEAFDKDLKYIKMLLKAEVARHFWDSKHYYMIRILGDEEVEAALELMPEAERIGRLHQWEKEFGSKL